MTTILVVAAHADDEVLGCGGTIAKHAKAGDEVHILFMADGVGSRGSTKELAAREEAARKAADIMGAQEPVFLGLPDNRMDGLDLLDIVQPLEKHIAAIQPSVIYTHHGGDLNVDHQLTHKAVMTACRPQPGFCVKEILSFEVLSSTEWAAPRAENACLPAMAVNIGECFDAKMAALKAYDMEMRAFPHARSYEAVEALAVYRGASFGYEKAEAFVINRIIKD